MPDTTLCLCMIVKNEAKIIRRLFDSVVNIIDFYCISDTGSTDGTPEVIEEYFSKTTKTGKVLRTGKFTNFAYDRTLALQACQQLPADYVLLMDADMILQIGPKFKKSDIKLDCYNVLQGSEKFYYNNLRIARNMPGYKYIGVTHEYVDRPPNSKMGSMSKDQLFILDIGDGGCKADKYERDIKLLTQGIKDEPENEVRYRFYLANSYFDTGKFREAIEQYQKRIALKGWVQEVWYSWYRIGKCYKALKETGNMVDAWLCGYEVLPDRLENVYELVHFFRSNCRYKLAEFFYKLIRDKSLLDDPKKDNYLFLANDVYTCKLSYEWCIISYYIGVKDVSDEAVRVLNNTLDGWMADSVLYNLKFYPVKIPAIASVTLSTTHKIENVEFISSSPCIVPDPSGDGYLVNLRMVNYRINAQGKYDMKGINNCATTNKLLRLNKDMKSWQSLGVLSLNLHPEPWTYYIGVEDVRIYDNATKFIGVGYHNSTSKIGVVYGDYPLSDIGASEVSLKFKEAHTSSEFPPTGCEKNWVYFTGRDGSTKIVYSWLPLRIGSLNEDSGILSLDETVTDGIPRIFGRARGSTCGFTYKDEIWFVVHLVAYDTPRTYYHVIAVFDLDMKLRRYSAPLKLADKTIEYCLGIIVEDDRVLLSYSEWDSTSIVSAYSKEVVETFLKY